MKNDLLRLAESIFSDDSCFWPLQRNVFYLGKFPSLKKYINEITVKSEILRRRVVSHISTDWHSRCIRLAGRIFGDYQRRMAVMNGCRKRPTWSGLSSPKNITPHIYLAIFFFLLSSFYLFSRFRHVSYFLFFLIAHFISHAPYFV